MYNWFIDRHEIKNKTINAIMEEFDSLINESTESANYWIDRTHNVFAVINDNGDDDKWIEIHYELYDCNEEMIGDLLVLDTENVSKDEVLHEIVSIVDYYYGE